MLGKKKNISDEEWLRAWNDCTNIISKPEIDEKTKNTIARLKRHCGKYKKIAFGYTGGKDSIVLADLMKKSGVDAQPIMWKTPLQFPVMEKWIEENKPSNIITIVMKYGDYEFLEKNPKWLFTQGTITGWMSKKWKEQKEYLESNGYDCFITGRRILDQNNCGSKDNDYIKKGALYDAFNLIADWKHEEVFAYIQYNGLSLPPCYFWNRGFKIGSGAWAERDAYERSEAEMWDEIYSIDKSVVYEAAEHLTSARNYLKERGKL